MLDIAIAAGLLTVAGQQAEPATPTLIEARASQVVTLEAETAVFSMSVTLNTPQPVARLEDSANRALQAANASVSAFQIEAAFNYADQGFWDIFFSDYEPSDPPYYITVRGTGSLEAINTVLAWARERGEVSNLYQNGDSAEPAPGALSDARQAALEGAAQNAAQLAAATGCELGQPVSQLIRQGVTQRYAQVDTGRLGPEAPVRAPGLTANYAVEAVVTFEAQCE